MPTSDDYAQRAIGLVLRLEGGETNDPDDPGGRTKYGLSQRTYPTLDFDALTEAQARTIYRRDWWEKYGYARLPGGLAVLLFQLAVNMGPVHAHSLLQRALADLGMPVHADGMLGPVTVRSASEYRYPEVLELMIRAGAIERYRRLGKPKYLAGWVRRAMA
jgi:lysozyme family protein